jgi:hypothetical protein
MPSKYTPLEEHLRVLRLTQKEATMTFGQIESILGSALPASAHEDVRWWPPPSVGHLPQIRYKNRKMTKCISVVFGGGREGAVQCWLAGG